MLIAFIGMDGTGKTTLAKKTAIELSNTGINSIYLKTLEYVILKPFRSSKLVKEIGRENLYATRSKKPAPMRLWPYFTMIDNLIHYFIKIKFSLFQGKTVVCDRYYYDFITNFEHFKFCGNSTKKIYSRIIPRPDIVFVLDADPEIAYKRAGEFDRRFYKQQRKRYNDLATKFNFDVVDTSQKPDNSFKYIFEKIQEKVVAHGKCKRKCSKRAQE